MTGIRLENLVRDRYDREARLKPALLAALPAALGGVAWLPTSHTLGATLVSVLTFFGAAAWLSHFTRDRGTRLQVKLYSAWGGTPSTTALRHRDSLIPEPLKLRYHAFLGRCVPGIAMPSEEAEAKDPEMADQVYESACAWLLTQTRDKKRFPLLFEENVSYGFRRNFLALKPFALTIAVIAIVSGVAVALWKWNAQQSIPGVASLGPITFALAYAIACIATVTSDWVRRAAFAYARQLLAACDVLDGTHEKGERLRKSANPKRRSKKSDA